MEYFTLNHIFPYPFSIDHPYHKVNRITDKTRGIRQNKNKVHFILINSPPT